MKTIIPAAMAVMLISLLSSPLFSHCEIPCGIYGDEMRLDMIEEQIATVEKSMNMIVKLSKGRKKNYNQIVRWVNNKEKHAGMIQDTVSQYFMTQRIKPVDEKNPKAYKQYTQQLTLLHQMLIYSMKAKQSTDLSAVKKLKSLLESFRLAYSRNKV